MLKKRVVLLGMILLMVVLATTVPPCRRTMECFTTDGHGGCSGL